MKLIQCYIENFGKLKNQTVAFSGGCHCFCHENGWGKSTLAAFLTVMLYGFEKERSRDDYANERKRYRPWQGGLYGGTLTFETGGKIYTVERTFGLKEKEDHFSVREEETNLETTAFSSNLGEEIFHLDRDSFERTVFISQKDCSVKTTDRIQAKLSNLAEATDDMNQYEKADARLHDLLNAMSPHRKTGSLYRMKEDMDDLNAQLIRGGILEKEIDSLMKEKQEMEASYLKYKEVQEQLLLQQRQISMEEEEKPEQKKEHFDRSTKGWSGIILAMVLLSFITGGIFFSQYREAAFLILVFGSVVLAAGLFYFFRRKYIGEEAKTNERNDLLEHKKKQTEEILQRLRKIQIMIETSYRQIVHLEHEIQDKRKKAERLLEKEEQLQILKELYTKDLLRYERLKLTKEYLAAARESYLSKYRSPLMSSFSRFYELLTGQEDNGFRMDSNLQLTIQEYGIQRETRYYSEGWKDLIGICMRMALVDVMYRKEKPFLIMDDPFVNLDHTKTRDALEFLKTLGEEYQVLYFTCHESRKL